MRGRLTEQIRVNAALFDVELTDDALARIADYYDLVQEHNGLLHLVAPCPPEQFAVRHILESLTLLEFLPTNAKFADVGSGAGLPSIPCLIARPDLRCVLIESKFKKARFLDEAIERLGLQDRAEIVNKQFEETEPKNARLVTCRALDKFAQKLPRVIKWSQGRTLLFFGGPALRIEMEKLGLAVREKLMPLSERRYLFVTSST